ncbi:Asp23/Gls24 family envelope stress response protein [Staphylococcus massiliensis]|uniref:Asp23/Gls24 family envelope stress response protein n=1 Tax=Staphylococcus massiliensis TaxID=555791 RepID=UPI001EDEC9A4|nr:Asp23/Gls24 family envelope stress response protein [Staphylococcus massiliensis]MCG3398961.1 Asp23/Gls24 family envelope stress response protein [Staphylococcus massiliensis]MCG3413010.1 Asp23/Gls24 family envelope stress response protein [Staphylococcus massiliensis]
MVQAIAKEHPNLGNVEIAPEVISVIASIAASEVEGVHGLFSDFKDITLERFGKRNPSKGIKVETKDNEIYIDVYCSFKYGTRISETAHKVQNAIHNSIKTMSAITPKQVNIHISHIEVSHNKKVR